ncbi:flavin-containing monooxygenase [Patulibacter minatonensis]|uniref:flavin-containing monooxygenase n=1 Tax=Patulibacter minatonensis TaxID=298163 RepID=UPI00047DBCB3|nr:NAD(P)/FAD-dependent oxidoreductase [Patulibacter minatonensis]
MSDQHHDVVIVGGGLAGLYMLHRVRRLGLSVVLLEAGDGIGGVWHFNRYPGARCDVESVDYSYSFDPELDQEWHWTERYASQPEILSYIEHVADRHGLREDVRLNTRVEACTFDEDTGHWSVRTDGGDLTARFCVMATGALSVPRIPDVPGTDDFRGRLLHTASWPREPVDLAGKRVAVVGTGSSGTQIVPELAAVAEHVTVFQRTPNFTVPAQHRPMDPEYEREVKSSYPDRRTLTRTTASGLSMDTNRESAEDADPERRRAVYEEQWRTAGFGFILAFQDLLLTRAANDTAVDFIHGKIAEQVEDPATAALLQPTDHPFGTKRPCVASTFYATFNRDNVTLEDLRRAPIEAVTETGLRTCEAEHAFDVIVFATGFDAITGALDRIEIRGRGGETLREHWADGPGSYLGLAVAGFPNLLTIAGPGSPSVLSNVVVSIEQHVEWIAGLLEHMDATGAATFEAEQDAEDAWVAHVNALADATLYPVANSWYVRTDPTGEHRVFMPYPGGNRRYRRRCDEIAAGGYEGFVLRPARESLTPSGD